MSDYAGLTQLVLPGPQTPDIVGPGLRNHRQAIAGAALGTGLFKVCFLGHSVTQGYLATTNARTWGRLCAANIATSLSVTNTSFYVPLSANANYITNFAIAPGALTEVNDSGLCGEAAYIPVGSTATITQTCDRFWIHAQKGAGVGTQFTYTVDAGAAQGPVSAGVAPRQGGRIWDHGGLASAAHTIVITPDATFGSVVEGITFFQGAGNSSGAQGFITGANAQTGVGVRAWVAGHFGYQTSQYAVRGFSAPITGDANSQALFTDPMQYLQPNTIVISLGINDIINGVSANQFMANLQTMVNTIQASATAFSYTMPSLVFVSEYGTSADTTNRYLLYAAALKTFCYTRGYGYIDLSQLIGSITGNTVISSDSLHPNDTGHRMIARFVANYLLDI